MFFVFCFTCLFLFVLTSETRFIFLTKLKLEIWFYFFRSYLLGWLECCMFKYLTGIDSTRKYLDHFCSLSLPLKSTLPFWIETTFLTLYIRVSVVHSFCTEVWDIYCPLSLSYTSVTSCWMLCTCWALTHDQYWDL